MIYKRKQYQKNYRKKYGDKMQQQIQKWFHNHPGYRERYCRDWKKKNQLRYNEYMRFYMKKYRKLKLTHIN